MINEQTVSKLGRGHEGVLRGTRVLLHICFEH